jgi:hypothetical protein
MCASRSHPLTLTPVTSSDPHAALPRPPGEQDGRSEPLVRHAVTGGHHAREQGRSRRLLRRARSPHLPRAGGSEALATVARLLTGPARGARIGRHWP